MSSPDPFEAFGKPASEPTDENRALAAILRNFHQANVIVGFSDQQAMTLTAELLRGALK